MKWINNALLCCVQRGRLDYELSGEQEAQQWGVRCTPPRSNTRQGRRKMLWCTYIKMSDKTCQAESQMCSTCTSSRGVYTHGIYAERKQFHSQPGRGHGGANTHSCQGREGPRDTLSHTHRLKCHTGESGRTAGRGELSSPGKICPCRCCLSDLRKRARPHGDTQRKVMDPVTQQLERGRA